MNAIVPAQTAKETVKTLVPAGMFTSPERFEFGQRVAQVFATSDIVPAHMKGKISNCLIAMHMAERLNEDPLTTIQNIMIVNGRPGFMTNYMIARANKSGVFKGRITWASAGKGDDLVVTASAALADTGEIVSAETSMAMAKAEGWTKNSKYQSMPEHMLRFRSAAMLIRLFCPEVMLGMQTAEELEAPSVEVVDMPRRTRAPRPPTDDATTIDHTTGAAVDGPSPTNAEPTNTAAGPAETAAASDPSAAEAPATHAVAEGKAANQEPGRASRRAPPRPPAGDEREYGTEESMRAAWAEGAAAQAEGKSRRAIPPEYNEDGCHKERACWIDGFEGRDF